MRLKTDPSTAVGMTAFEGAKAKGRADGCRRYEGKKREQMSTTPAGGPLFFRVSRWYEKASDCEGELEFVVGERRRRRTGKSWKANKSAA